jgi:hypothetical protein
VNIKNDTDVEGSETIEIALGNPFGATILGPNPVVLTIRDSEPVFQFSQPESVVVESSLTKTITVRRTGPLKSPATVNYHITGGTAAADVDYIAAPSGTISFAAGKPTQTLTIVPIDDRTDEPGETVTLALENPSAGYGIGTPGTAILTINDNDVAGKVQFSGATYSVSEDAGSATITVTRTGGTSEATVGYATSNGTATAGVNYVEASGTLHFGFGETIKTITVPVLNDGVAANSFLNLALSNPGGKLELGPQPTAVLWIVDSP